MYTLVIMKNNRKLRTILQYQSLTRPDEIFYAFDTWPTKEIEGVTFQSVSKVKPTYQERPPTQWIRKDSVKRI